MPVNGAAGGATQLTIRVVAEGDSLLLASADVLVVSSLSDSSQQKTNQQGLVRFENLAGRKFWITIAKSGYREIQAKDSSAVWDSASGLSYRSLTFVMRRERLESDTAFVVNIRDENGKRLAGAYLQRDDGDLPGASVAEGNELGRIGVDFANAAANTQWVAVCPGYLSKRFRISIPKKDSLGAIPQYSISLPALHYRLRGTIKQASPLGPRLLERGAVEFTANDTDFVPRSFRVGLSDSLSTRGVFVFDSLPAIPGKLSVFRDKNGVEPAATQEISRNDILRDAVFPEWIIDSQGESALRSWVLTWPGDSLNAGDTLKFRFSEKVAAVENLKVGIPNVTEEIWVKYDLVDSGKTLRMTPRDGLWIEGRTYGFQLQVLGESGTWLTRANDTATTLKGGFTIRTSATGDTTLAYPEKAEWAYFHSGENPRFDSSDALSSPLPDSSNRFARLRWHFKTPAQTKVDSLVLYARDDKGLTGGWMRMEAFPAAAESATVVLNFGLPSLRIGNDNPIRIRLAAKQGKSLVSGREWNLPPLQQAMGPSLWVHYAIGDSLRLGENARDTVLVRLLTAADTQSVAYDFGSNRPKPILLLNGKPDSTHLAWEWKDGQSGRLIYAFSGYPGLQTRLQADWNDVASASGPIWIRNRNEAVVLP